ncbi:hypothetical protein QI037_10420 [Staphylococcus saprophyticus]|uniref:Phage protein n=1 Tax=Staphylococcus cohnii TaxID=29382 RepID=A0ABT6J2R6_9STAP|nr:MULTISPECIES: hypothetical protein [Staphylococcus]MDH5140527.1 hypothetical protein [Staphylococcus cohnii]MDH5159053.1 hypothetical protein [Staphylococcus cohnii]MDH5170111.1 hypothetical protein [Staphylococcus cohnii]MDW3800413.1 hypothetical protein [Staphylococcus saprophyticus]MDW3983230.1 hypothetical protein [Staphylococcus saprophyticus]
MPKKSLMNNVEGNLENSFINKDQKLSILPQTSLRVKGATHSKINVLKKVEMMESYDEILDEALNLYITKYPEEKQDRINNMIMEENDYKIKKARKKTK